MKVEYDPVRDLLYIWFAGIEKRAARTEVIVPGVHADFDQEGRLIGIEVLEASKVLGHRITFEVDVKMAPVTVQA